MRRIQAILLLIITAMSAYIAADIYNEQKTFRTSYETDLHTFQHSLHHVALYLHEIDGEQSKEELASSLVHASIWLGKLKVSTNVLARHWETMGVNTFEFVHFVTFTNIEQYVHQQHVSDDNVEQLLAYRELYALANEELNSEFFYKAGKNVIQTKLTKIVKLRHS